MLCGAPKSLCASHCMRFALRKLQGTPRLSLCANHFEQVALRKSLCASAFLKIAQPRSLSAGRSAQGTLRKFPAGFPPRKPLRGSLYASNSLLVSFAHVAQVKRKPGRASHPARKSLCANRPGQATLRRSLYASYFA